MGYNWFMKEYAYEEQLTRDAEKALKDNTSFWCLLDGFLRRNKAMLGSLYVLCMTAAVVLLVVMNNPSIMAGGDYGGGYGGAPVAVNAVLWSFVVVANFLAIAAFVFLVVRGRRLSKRGQ